MSDIAKSDTLDRAAIVNLISAYAFGLDQRDCARVASTFSEEAVGEPLLRITTRSGSVVKVRRRQRCSAQRLCHLNFHVNTRFQLRTLKAAFGLSVERLAAVDDNRRPGQKRREPTPRSSSVKSRATGGRASSTVTGNPAANSAWWATP